MRSQSIFSSINDKREKNNNNNKRHGDGRTPTQQVSGHVDWQYDSQRSDGDDHEQGDEVTLEGEVMYGVGTTSLCYRFLTEKERERR